MFLGDKEMREPKIISPFWKPCFSEDSVKNNCTFHYFYVVPSYHLCSHLGVRMK